MALRIVKNLFDKLGMSIIVIDGNVSGGNASFCASGREGRRGDNK